MAGVVLDEQSCVRDLDDREFFFEKAVVERGRVHNDYYNE